MLKCFRNLFVEESENSYFEGDEVVNGAKWKYREAHHSTEASHSQ